MERAEIAETITELMEDVFDVDDLVYSDDLDASQVEEWDILKRIHHDCCAGLSRTLRVGSPPAP